MTKQPSVLIIYTGGTIGMMEDSATGTLKPFNFSHLAEQIPEIKKFNIRLSSISFEKPIDSSDMSPAIWVKMAEIIAENYLLYDGFVILHGSDTMAYSSSALSFMLENLSKPVILTGSQLPIGMIRTDGKENLITAIEIAAAKQNNVSIIQEVAVYFEYRLYRGNRTHKFNAEHFQAFQSPNYPILAEAGVHINYNAAALHKNPEIKPFRIHASLCKDIAIIKIFPGITNFVFESILGIKELKAVIIETYGAGNASINSELYNLLDAAIKKDIIILNISQCQGGKVEQGKYETSSEFAKLGVVGGSDMTTEAAVTKLMHLLGQSISTEEIKFLLSKSLRGELTESEPF